MSDTWHIAVIQKYKDRAVSFLPVFNSSSKPNMHSALTQ